MSRNRTCVSSLLRCMCWVGIVMCWQMVSSEICQAVQYSDNVVKNSGPIFLCRFFMLLLCDIRMCVYIYYMLMFLFIFFPPAQDVMAIGCSVKSWLWPGRTEHHIFRQRTWLSYDMYVYISIYLAVLEIALLIRTTFNLCAKMVYIQPTKPEPRPSGILNDFLCSSKTSVSTIFLFVSQQFLARWLACVLYIDWHDWFS